MPVPDLAPAISVVIPALDEARELGPTLGHLFEGAGAGGRVEAIVVDGGSRDATAAIAVRSGARVLPSRRGRALQMNAGAAAARGDVLLFLHADTRLPRGWPDHVLHTLALPGVVAGAFRLRIDGAGAGLRLVEAGVALRCLALRLPYGDQALFMTRERFASVGGYRPMRRLEDLDLVARVRTRGTVALAGAPVVTSARAWARRGLVRQTLENGWLAVSYAVRGPSPFDLGEESLGDGIPLSEPSDPARVFIEPENFAQCVTPRSTPEG